MSEVFEIFEPGLRHLREERDRKRLEIQVPASAAPPFGIDLDAGVAYIAAGGEAAGHPAENHRADDASGQDRSGDRSGDRLDDQPPAT